KFNEPANWSIKAGNNPAQNELTNVTVMPVSKAQDPSATPQDWMFMSMERTKVQGTFALLFEFNKNAWNGQGGTLVRSTGDLVVRFELSGNPTDAQTDLFIRILKYEKTNSTCAGYPLGVHSQDTAPAGTW